MARIRNRKFNTVHHLTSRIAHRVFFLKNEERDDFIALMKRVSAFSGVDLLGWCIMDNHFHIFVHLPVPPLLSDEEVLRRFALLKGDSSRLLADEGDDRIPPSPFALQNGGQCQTPPANSETGSERQPPSAQIDAERTNLVKSIRRRMYSIAEYMRMIKKWFSDDYNSRSGHKGTMWEAVYGDRALPLPDNEGNYDDLRNILGYIHLNPIRAALTDRFDGYAWSSYSAFIAGDVAATEAIRHVYPGIPDGEIRLQHEKRMANLLEAWKLSRAKEIARKRALGYEEPADPLTDECMIAQAQAHAVEVQKAIERLHAERDLARSARTRRVLVYRQIQHVLELHPGFTARDLSSVINLPERTIYRHLATMRANGLLPPAT